MRTMLFLLVAVLPLLTGCYTSNPDHYNRIQHASPDTVSERMFWYQEGAASNRDQKR